jgi:hypothetical protein
MSGDSVIVLCPKCGTKNRVPRSRWEERPRCGRCKEIIEPASLFPDTPIGVNDATFRREVASFPGPVLLDFTAPW